MPHNCRYQPPANCPQQLPPTNSPPLARTGLRSRLLCLCLYGRLHWWTQRATAERSSTARSVFVYVCVCVCVCVYRSLCERQLGVWARSMIVGFGLMCVRLLVRREEERERERELNGMGETVRFLCVCVCRQRSLPPSSLPCAQRRPKQASLSFVAW